MCRIGVFLPQCFFYFFKYVQFFGGRPSGGTKYPKVAKKLYVCACAKILVRMRSFSICKYVHFLREALITFGVVFLAGCFRPSVRLFVRNFRDFYRRDMPIRRMLLSTETLTKKTHLSISVLKSNPRKVRLAITASLELTQNRDLFLELFLDFL